jgi:tRNA1(Val) A37 N6-methylase TrmN6
MTHTHSQDLEACFTALHSNLTDTQQEVIKLSANISTINQKMHSSIVSSISELKDDIKKDITTQLESVTMMIYAKMHIPTDLLVSNPPFHTEGETSSHSQNFQPYHFQHDLCLLHVDVTKFDGSDPTG